MSGFEEPLKSKARYKTKLRTVRLPVALDSALEEEAGKRTMSTNSFIISILEKFDEWDRQAERFHFMAFPKEQVRDEFAALEDLTLMKRLARSAGATVPREMMLFWFKDVNLESFLKYLALQARYQRYAHYEIRHHDEKTTIIAKHDLGPNWSAWLEGYIGEAIKSNLGVTPRIESSPNTVRFEFQNSKSVSARMRPSDSI
jgi:hypothetical protein